MAETAHLESLAEQHMRRQVREAAAVQVALGRYWDRIVDPNDFARTFAKFREVALPLINAGRIRGETAADDYYRALMLAEDYEVGAAIAHGAPNPAAVRASLSASSKADWNAYRLNRGDAPGPIMTAAKAAMLAAAKRHVLNASRDRLIVRQQRDPNVRGWARVSDGKPCAFCAMLVSRGPVYSGTTGDFRAHDGCGCSVRLITRNDPTGGWTESARALREAWDKAPDLNSFRSHLTRKAKADGLALAA